MDRAIAYRLSENKFNGVWIGCFFNITDLRHCLISGFDNNSQIIAPVRCRFIITSLEVKRSRPAVDPQCNYKKPDLFHTNNYCQSAGAGIYSVPSLAPLTIKVSQVEMGRRLRGSPARFLCQDIRCQMSDVRMRADVF